MQLICDYRVDPPIVVGHFPDELTVDMDHDHLKAFVLVPFSGDLETLPKVGPEPELMGDPPTKCYPSHEVLTKEGVPESVLDERGQHKLDDDGKPLSHWLRLVAGKPYPDNRRLAEDTRPYAAPTQSDPVAQLAYLAHVRWTAEVGGVVVDGFPAYTTRAMVPIYEAAASRAARDPKYTKSMTGTDGKPYDLDADKLVKVSDAVQDHVEACFALQSKLKDAIAAGKVKNFTAIDGAFSTL